MAKVDGIIEISGTVKGITFYRTKYGIYARAKGGISKKRIQTDSAFERTRENCNEFGHCAKMAQLLRKSVGGLQLLAKDPRVSSRLSKAMNQIKNLDAVSVRGQRRVGIGIQTIEGKKILKGFDFNDNALMSSVFRGELILDRISGVVVLNDFSPSMQMTLADGATHISLSTIMSIVDFEQGVYSSSSSSKVTIEVAAPVANYSFTPSVVPSDTGIVFYFFLIEFFQEINGIQYSLKNNSYNVLGVLEVGA
jgi:hypothetical protein